MEQLMESLPFLHQGAKGLLIEVYVQPKASKNEIGGLHQDRLKLRLTAPPVEGEANKECIKFLSEIFKVPKTDIEIVRGQKSRQKTVLIRDLSSSVARSALQNLV
jgi:uncharacterized protein (TIGR00251 family)